MSGNVPVNRPALQRNDSTTLKINTKVKALQ